MTEKFIFWAQALDNSSPDHIEVHGQGLSPDDGARRQKAVSLVSSVVKAGTRVFDSGAVQLTADRNHFVIEVPSAQRDRAGRTAPIVCYGDYDSMVGEALGDSVAVALAEFAERIGRRLQAEHLELARGSFAALKKKSSTRRLARVIGIAAVALAVLALSYWLASRGFSPR